MKYSPINFLHKNNTKVHIIVNIVRRIGNNRLEYNNGWIQRDKSLSQWSAPTLAMKVIYNAMIRMEKTLVCYREKDKEQWEEEEE
jgi:hypothetical protein